jgi:putative oxidoreductase
LESSVVTEVEEHMEAGLLIIRLAFGLLMAAHGCQKLFGWFGGPGIDGTAAYLEALGFRPGRLFAVANALAEVGGGVFLAVGLFEPAAAAVIMSVMIVAIATVHWGNGLLATTNGIELPLLYLTAALSLALSGPGNYSIDAAVGLTRWWTPDVIAVVLAVGIVGAFASLGTRRTVPAAAHA